MKRSQTGLGIIAAIMILVILGGLSAAIVSLSTGQQMSSAQDVLSAQAWQVASAGTEGGLFDALQSGKCATATWASAAHPAFKVTVVCTSSAPDDFNDGETSPTVARVLRVFRIVATACNGGAGDCPNDAASAGAGYVERQGVAIAYCTLNAAKTACVATEP